jgi:uncharacterized membrane protein YhaH (DUF805 family)
LERLLKGRLPSAQVAETLGEVEAHLTDSAEELAPSCVHGEDPEALAVERFGPPRKVAFGFIEAHGRLPYWRTGGWLIGLFLAALITVLASYVIPCYAGKIFVDLHPVFFACVVVGFAWVGFRSRRPQVAAISAAAALAFVIASIAVPLVAELVNGNLTYTQYLGQMATDLKEHHAKLAQDRAWLHWGIAAFATGDPHAVPAQYRRGKGYICFEGATVDVTYYGVQVEVEQSRSPTNQDPLELPPGSLLSLQSGAAAGAGSVQKFARARDWWQHRAPGLRDECDAVDKSNLASIADLESAETDGYSVRWVRDLHFALCAAGEAWLLGVALHLASVSLGRMWLTCRLLRRQLA